MGRLVQAAAVVDRVTANQALQLGLFTLQGHGRTLTLQAELGSSEEQLV